MIYLIVALAAFLRLYQLESLPISLFGDEIDVGYHAWSLITTGRDYMGNFLPSYIQSLAEWRTPLIMYLTAPFIGLLGPTTLAVRLPVALLGIANIYLIYLLTNLLFPKLKSKKFTIGHLSALILTLTPWHLHYSRASFEVTLLLTLLLLGTWAFLKYVTTQKIHFISVSILSFALTFYTYSTANLFTPFLIFSLLLIYKPNIKNLFSKKNIYWTIIPALLILPITYQLFFGQVAGRFKGISVFNDGLITDDIVNQRTEPWVEQGREVAFHNKPLSYISTIGSNYLTPFSPQFLFLDGDLFNRHSLPRFGQLLWVTAPFLILGFVALIQNLSKKSNKLLLVWLLLSPLPSSLTQGGDAHATRLFIMLPPLIIITALGIHYLKQKLTNQFFRSIFWVILVVGTLTNSVLYFHQYSNHYRYQSASIWSYGYQDIFSQLKNYQDEAGKIYINNTFQPSLLRFAFHTKLPPKEFQKLFTSDVPSDNFLPTFNGFSLGDKYYFGRIKEGESIKDLLEPGDIYLAVQLEEVPGDWDWSKEPPAGLKSLGVTNDVFGKSLFHLVTPD